MKAFRIWHLTALCQRLWIWELVKDCVSTDTTGEICIGLQWKGRNQNASLCLQRLSHSQKLFMQPFLTEFGNASSGLLKCLLKQTNGPQDGTTGPRRVIRWGNNPEVKCGEDQLDLFYLFTLNCTNTSQSWNVQMITENICLLIPDSFSYCCCACWALNSCIKAVDYRQRLTKACF